MGKTETDVWLLGLPQEKHVAAGKGNASLQASGHQLARVDLFRQGDPEVEPALGSLIPNSQQAEAVQMTFHDGRLFTVLQASVFQMRP